MRKLIKCLLILLIGVSVSNANAQLFKRLKNKLENKLERKLETEVDKSTDKALDSLSTAKKDKKQTTTPTSAAANVYEFTDETLVKMTTSEDEKPINMSYLLNPKEAYVGMKIDMSQYSEEEMQGESIVIMDGGNVHIFVETMGMKMLMSQGMMAGQQINNPADQMADYDYSGIVKTGNTKTVLGATCYEYSMSDKDVTMNLWVAPEIDLPNWFIQNTEVIEGHIMAYTMTSKDGVVTSETIAIKENISKTVIPSEYKKMF